MAACYVLWVEIRRANLDGSEEEVIVDLPQRWSNEHMPVAIAVNSLDQKIY